MQKLNKLEISQVTESIKLKNEKKTSKSLNDLNNISKFGFTKSLFELNFDEENIK